MKKLIMTEENRKKLELLKAKNLGKKFIEEYLRELKALTNVEVSRDSLISIEETKNFPRVEGKKKKLTYKFDLKNKLLPLLFDQLIETKDGNLLLFTYYSQFCGAMNFNSLKNFNTQFSFNAEHSGIIELILCDCSNKLLLDFYEEEGEYLLDIEITGIDWSSVL